MGLKAWITNLIQQILKILEWLFENPDTERDINEISWWRYYDGFYL